MLKFLKWGLRGSILGIQKVEQFLLAKAADGETPEEFPTESILEVPMKPARYVSLLMWRWGIAMRATFQEEEIPEHWTGTVSSQVVEYSAWCLPYSWHLAELGALMGEAHILIRVSQSHTFWDLSGWWTRTAGLPSLLGGEGPCFQPCLSHNRRWVENSEGDGIKPGRPLRLHWDAERHSWCRHRMERKNVWRKKLFCRSSYQEPWFLSSFGKCWLHILPPKPISGCSVILGKSLSLPEPVSSSVALRVWTVFL